MKNNSNNMKIVLVLAVLLVVAIGYIGFDMYNEYSLNKQVAIYQEGLQYGYEQAVIYLAQQVATCQQVPITVENQTINVVAVECLQQ